uniref:Uncharacterized protein n=1 Tax=Anguilla anguilla TaxID=7936 RepID=A0A0E9XRE8_ANGAN
MSLRDLWQGLRPQLMSCCDVVNRTGISSFCLRENAVFKALIYIRSIFLNSFTADFMFKPLNMTLKCDGLHLFCHSKYSPCFCFSTLHHNHVTFA